MFRVVCVLIGYGFGCIQPAYWITRHKLGRDIRELGTGNMGTANVTQSVGARAGAITLLFDLLKTVGAICLCMWLCRERLSRDLAVVYAGAGVVLGHDFPFYLHFKGGKGVAATIGMMLMLDSGVFNIVFVAALLALVSSRALVMGVVALAIAFPIGLFAYGYSGETVLVATLLSFLMVTLHRSSFQRMKKQKQEEPDAAIPADGIKAP